MSEQQKLVEEQDDDSCVVEDCDNEPAEAIDMCTECLDEVRHRDSDANYRSYYDYLQEAL